MPEFLPLILMRSRLISLAVMILVIPGLVQAVATGTNYAASSSSLVGCTTLIQRIQARRQIRLKKMPACDPVIKARVSASSSSSSLSYSRPRSSSSASSVSSSSSAAAASSSLSIKAIPPSFYDQQDTTIRSQFLLLGEVGPVIGAAKAFLYEEPLDVTDIDINLTTDVASTVNSLQVYRDDRGYLGRATLNATSSTARNFHLTLPSGSFLIDKATERGIYVRPDIRSKNNGGISNTMVQIDSVTFKGHGAWSSQNYTKASASHDVYLPFVTSRSVIKRILNAGEKNAALVTGKDRTIASFQFEGRSPDTATRLAITDLSFTIEQTGDVQLSNARLLIPGISDAFYCTTTTQRVQCDGLPDSFGAISDGFRTMQVVADIFALDPLHASVRLTLNEPGNPYGIGSVQWSDGTSAFTWVPFTQPVVEGTMWKY